MSDTSPEKRRLAPGVPVMGTVCVPPRELVRGVTGSALTLVVPPHSDGKLGLQALRKTS